MQKSKNKLVNGFIIGTFVSLYLLVSIISTIHVIDFFELSNPRWMAITLAIGFEVGAAASLASLIVMEKMNKTLIWALFITITAMQINGNLYYAFINMQDYQNWAELFNLLEWEPIAQKRLLAAVSGAILPLVALGFIKSLVDYIKPEDDSTSLKDEELDEIVSDINNSSEKKTKVVSEPSINEIEVNDPIEVKPESIDTFEDLDVTVNDGLEDENWDEDHAMDQVLNNIVEDLDEDTLKELEDEIEESFEDLDELEDELDDLEDQIEEVETEQELDELEDKIEELEEKIEELEEDIEEDIDELTESAKRLKKGPLWQFRTNYKDDDKFD